ncbi:MAG: TolC family protein [Halanaerobiaceae bacterium]|nr:TolC family protein [Halanaerobiaceae bacterium]
MQAVNKKRKRISYILPIAILAFLFFTYTCSFAEEIDSDRVLETGLKNNNVLQEKKDYIKALKRERGILEAGVDWYLGINGNYLYSSEKMDSNFKIIDSGDISSLVLEGGKNTAKGFSINFQLSLTDEGVFQFKDPEDKYRFRLDLSKRLYPLVPTETEKKFILVDNDLIIAEADLAYSRKSKEIEWLESYLNILSLQERLKYSEERYQLALANLKKVREEQLIAEAGKAQLLMAEITMREALLQKKQIENSFVQANAKLILETGVEGDIAYNENSQYLSNFSRRMDTINIELSDDEIEGLLKKNNVQLRQIMFNKDYAENELKWQSKEDNIKVDGFGRYNYDAVYPDDFKDYWEVGLGFSYDFYDGGRQKLAMENIRAKIEGLEEKYEHTLKELKLQLDVLMNQYRLDLMNLETKEISMEKARLEKELYKEQYSKGLISEAQYKELDINLKEAELAYKEAGDKVLFDKARIALFLGLF